MNAQFSNSTSPIKGGRESILAIVIPCYKEQEVLPETIRRMTALLDGMVSKGKISPDSYMLLVNDGSTDRTWDIITEDHATNHYVRGINLAANVGHQNALWAGLTFAKDHADAIVSIDADLQDDVEAIETMVDHYHEGCDVVYGVRNERKTDSVFKRTTALAFYKIMLALGTKTVYNHADFRLMSSRAVEFLCQFPERNLFIRGLVPLVGYKSACVYYDRKARFAGESKYPFSKMLNFAVDGITSFSVKPIRMVFFLGIFFLLIALAVLIWTLVAYFSGNVIRGWASLMLSVWFCSGCVLVSLGVVGEYIGKIYIETKERPRYNTESVLF